VYYLNTFSTYHLFITYQRQQRSYTYLVSLAVSVASYLMGSSSTPLQYVIVDRLGAFFY